MKILLVQPFKDFGLYGESYPAVGLGYLATAVREGDNQVSILDCLKDGYNYDKFIQRVKEVCPDLIGITLFSISIPFVKKMVDMIKKELPDTTVVLGGPHVSSLPHKVLRNFEKVDFAVRGEGEIPLRRLIKSLNSGDKNFSQIPGLIYRENNEIRVNEPYFPPNIEEYGFPAWDLIKPLDYFKYVSIGPNTVPVFFSRGCPFPCTFCAAKVTSGQRLRRRGLDHIFTELHLLQKEFDIKRFIIEDEGFGVTKKFIMAFCQRVKKENFKANFGLGVGMRLDFIDQELLEAMKEAGFDRTIVLGIESGSERILKLMKKEINLSMVWEKVNLMNKMGFEPNGYFILGYPGETKEEMEETIRWAFKLPIKEASFTAFQPLPATEATTMLIEKGELPEDFDFASLAQNKIVYAPCGMGLKQLEQIRKKAILRFYLRPRILLRYFKSFRAFMYAFKKVIAVFFKKNLVKENQLVDLKHER